MMREKDNPKMQEKPSITGLIGRYVPLRGLGKEYVGLCPFHDETHPSFSVNEEKSVFHCFGCGEGGDVIDFVQLYEQTDFKGALSILGMSGTVREQRKPETRRRRAAALLAAWMNEQHLKVGSLCRNLQRQIALAETIPDRELVESLSRAWEILSDLHEDLQKPDLAIELWQARDTIESLTANADREEMMTFPALTEPYRSYLRSIAC